MCRISLYLLMTAFICSYLASCAGNPEVMIEKDTVYEKIETAEEAEYLLGAGDVVEIVYHNTPRQDEKEYVLSVGDIIRVEFTYHGDIDRELTIRPDGKVALPRVGEIDAAGITASMLRQRLVRKFSKVFKDPEVTLTIIQYNRAIDRLKKAITTAPRGQSKLTTIRPDGYITFPMLREIKAAGLSLPSLKKIVSAEYKAIIDNLTVSLILKVMNGNLVYVMGEVDEPNYYLMLGPTTVMQVVSFAGGFLDTAEKSTVLVISKNRDNRPVGRIVNIRDVIANGNIAGDIVLRQYDIVYVPKSKIAQRGVNVEQYINKIIPRFIGGINFGYDLSDDI